MMLGGLGKMMVGETIDNELEDMAGRSGLDLARLNASCIVNDFLYQDLITIRGIDFLSCCEHSMKPTVGTVHIGYLPGSKVLGIGSFGRIVAAMTSLPMIQERTTCHIARIVQWISGAQGVIAAIDASHYCSGMSVQSQHAMIMRTVHVVGSIKEDVRMEFISYIGDHR